MRPLVPTAPIRHTIHLAVPARTAFDLFTAGLGQWWPRDNTWSKADLDAIVLEPRPGGRWFERDTHGRETPWGKVLSSNSPQRLVLAWQITPEWKPEPNAARASRVELRFIQQTPTSVRIDLEHRDFANHGPGGEVIRNAMAGDQGWQNLLSRFARAATRPGPAA